MLRRCLAFTAALLAPVALAAQVPAYRRLPGDTLRLREVTTTELVVRTPQGEVPLASRADAVIAVTFLPNDSARAWYESLMLEGTGPRTVERPGTAAALRQPFALRFDSRGRVRTLATPEFPAALARISDLRHQFDDFFPRLPAAPLRSGLAWTDTISIVDSSSGGQRSRTTGTARYRVERDTTVGGVRGVVVSMRQALRIETGGPIEGQPVTTESVLEGTDDGLFVFAPDGGRLLGRTRTGDLRGTVTLRGGQTPVSMPQIYRYQSTIEPAGTTTASAAVASTLTRFAVPPARLGPACASLADPAMPVVLSANSARNWREMYGILVPWFGREQMPLPDDVDQLSSSVYRLRGSAREPALTVLAVRFRNARAASEAARVVNARPTASSRQTAGARDLTLVIVGAPPGFPEPCRAAMSAAAAAELRR